MAPDLVWFSNSIFEIHRAEKEVFQLWNYAGWFIHTQVTVVNVLETAGC